VLASVLALEPVSVLGLLQVLASVPALVPALVLALEPV
jgi:hypothetical protein